MTAETPRRCHCVHCLCDVAEGEGRSVSALERVSASARCRILISFFSIMCKALFSTGARMCRILSSSVYKT